MDTLHFQIFRSQEECLVRIPHVCPDHHRVWIPVYIQNHDFAAQQELWKSLAAISSKAMGDKWNKAWLMTRESAN